MLKAQRGPQITQITQINKKNIGFPDKFAALQFYELFNWANKIQGLNKPMKTGCTSTNVFGWLTLQ
jgi:hypothetical protein